MYKGYTEFNNFLSLVKEGLIKSYPIKTTIRVLSKELGSQFIQHKIEPNIYTEEPKELFKTNTIMLMCLSNTLLDKDLISIFSRINFCGYFVSIFEFYDSRNKHIYSLNYRDLSKLFLKELNNNIKKSHYLQIQIESKFNNRVGLNNKLYHITNTKYIENILKNGLIPKSKNKKAHHLDRIYFGSDPVVVRGLAIQFGSGDYSILEIDTNDLDIKVYDDPDFTGYGSYTHENIPPKFIKVIDNFKLKNK